MSANDAPKPKVPKCPNCDVQPCMVGMNLIGFGQGAMAAVFFCGACEKILSVAPLEPPARMPEQPASKILLPS